MKNYYVKIMSVFLGLFILMYGYPVRADLPLQGKVIVVDSGHGGLDPGALYNDIYEKNITLAIGKYRNHRKKADFDERIKIINQKFIDMYVSIHLNYLTDSRYYGAQVFYNNDNKRLAESVQEYLNKNTNSDRNVKKIPTSTYMYDKLKTKGILVECGFLSNSMERSKLVTKEYQMELARVLSDAISHYYN